MLNSLQKSRTIKSAFQRSGAVLGKFAASDSGSFVPAFGIGVMAMMFSVGAAVDYSQLSRAKSFVNQALDSAILAAGNEMLKNAPADAKLRKIFDDQLFANLSARSYIMNRVAVNSFEVDRETGEISAELATPVEMAFMGLVGKQEVTVRSYSEANFSTNPVEISMVLDVTGSMNSGGKLGSLKLAAQDAIDILLPSNGGKTQTRIGLVPYSEGVRLDKNMALKASGQDVRTCMTERTYNPYNDTSYSSEYVSAIAGANCSSSRVRPLTDNASQLKKDVQALVANGFTAGQLGISWGYYMLSENWKGLWPNKSKPANYGGKTKKIVVLMTDGNFNTHFKGYEANPRGNDNNPSDPRVIASNTSAIALCDDMKNAAGIEVYSIAFNAPANAKATLQNCASPDTAKVRYFFDATSETELRTAFREIANSIKTLRLTR